MSAETILILATITPKPGKMDKVLELAEPLAKGIRDTEPNCIEFRGFREINPESGDDELYTVERFNDKAAVDFHQENPVLTSFVKAVTDQDLLTKPIVIRTVKAVVGFVRE